MTTKSKDKEKQSEAITNKEVVSLWMCIQGITQRVDKTAEQKGTVSETVVKPVHYGLGLRLFLARCILAMQEAINIIAMAEKCLPPYFAYVKALEEIQNSGDKDSDKKTKIEQLAKTGKSSLQDYTDYQKLMQSSAEVTLPKISADQLPEDISVQELVILHALIK